MSPLVLLCDWNVSSFVSGNTEGVFQESNTSGMIKLNEIQTDIKLARFLPVDCVNMK
jgi:hypothetical protein